MTFGIVNSHIPRQQCDNCLLLQVPAAKSRLDPGDVFILDMGLKVYQWNGSGASVFEKQKVSDYT